MYCFGLKVEISKIKYDCSLSWESLKAIDVENASSFSLWNFKYIQRIKNMLLLKNKLGLITHL